MKKQLILLFVILCSSAYGQTNDRPEYVSGEVYVKIHDSIPIYWEQKREQNISSFPMMQPYVESFGITGVNSSFFFARNPKLQRVLRVKFSKTEKTDEFIKILNSFKDVEYAEKIPANYCEVIPNDPDYSSQWQLPHVNAPAAWDITTGSSSIDIAVVDNAIETGHSDLSGNMNSGFDVADWDSDPNPPNSSLDHGTHVSGIASAKTDNGIGVAGLGWNCDIIPVKAQYDNGSPNGISHGFEGITWAAQNGAEIINCSWGGSGYSSTDQLVIDDAWNLGCILVVAAGNSNSSSPFYPAAYNHAFAVANTDQNDDRNSSSNYGSWVDISAPGTSIYSTVPYGNYGIMSGTSMASPLVAGLLGLVWSVDQSATQSAVISCVTSTAVSLSWSGGGAGRIDAEAAVLCAGGGSTGCQCTISNNQYPSSSLTPTSTWQFVGSQWAGEYSKYYVQNGETYTWTYCQSTAGQSYDLSPYDNRLNLYNDNGTYILCETDVCGLDAEITWTATFTGYIRVQTNEYINSGSQCNTNSINSDLYYRKISGGGGNAPIANFYTNNTNPSVGNVVSFFDQSSNSPTAWVWTVNPICCDYYFANGTNQNSQNPEIIFTATGCFEISLQAQNAYGYDDEIKNCYINVSNGGLPNLLSANAGVGFNAGDTIFYSLNINNNGNGNAGPFVVNFYASVTPVFNPIWVGTYNVSQGIPAGGTVNVQKAIDVCGLTISGSFYFGIFIDYANQIQESDESDNNTFFTGMPFNIGCLSTGIMSNNVEDKIIIFPNPLKDFINIISPANKKGIVEVFDITGRKVASEKLLEGNTKIDLQKLNAGIYNIRIVDEEHNFMMDKKILKL